MSRILRTVCLFVGVFPILILGVGLAPAQPAKKAAVPTKEALDKAEELVRELYKSELDKAKKDPMTQARLAIVFLQEGKDTLDDQAGRFVLLNKALAFASQAGDGPTALQAIEELAQEYKLPAAEVFDMKIKALGIASNAAASPGAYTTVVESSLMLLEDALAIDNFTAGLKLIQTAENAGKKLRNVALVSAIRKKQDDVVRLQKEFAHWQPFADRLSKDPADAEANTEMGKYQALVKGSWDMGLPLLKRGEDTKLKELASLDLSEPKEAAQQRELAAKWHALAKTLKDGMRIHASLRSYFWYQQALAGVEPAQVEAIEKQLTAIMESLPAEYRVGDIVTELKRLEGHLGPVFSVAFSSDGRKVVSGSADGSVRVWDAKSGKETRRFEGNNGRVWSVAMSPEGRRVASGGFDNAIRIWEVAAGREARRLPGHNDYVRSVAFSYDGHLILSGGDDRLVRMWNADSGKEIRSLPGHDHYVWSVALSRDSKLGLSASLDRTIRLWDIEAGAELKKLEGHKDTVLSVAFAPNGRRAVSGSTDKTLKIWDLETGKDFLTLTGHDGFVNSVAFSPDGRHVLSGGQDGTVRLWDANTGKELRKLEGHRDQVWSVAFSRDGRFAVSAGQDQTVRVWGGAR